MLEIESNKNYWEEFRGKYPDHNELRLFVSEDTVLTKFYNFLFVPFVLGKNIQKYPFAEKIIEADTITKDDKDFITDLLIEFDAITKRAKDYIDDYTPDLPKESDAEKEVKGYAADLLIELDAEKEVAGDFIDFLLARYTITKKGVELFKAGKERGMQEQSIITFIDLVLNKFLMVDSENTYKEENGTKKFERIIGRYFPAWMLHIVRTVDTRNNKITHIEQQIHLPGWEDLAKTSVDEFLDLDRFSVKTIKRYGEMVTGDSFLSEGEKAVRLYHRGKPVSEPFIFPVHERYRPLINKVIGVIQKSREGDKKMRSDLEASVTSSNK